MDDLYYRDAAYGKRLFVAQAIVTAPGLFSTAAGTGGPLLWNSTSDKIASIVAVGFAVTVASTVAGALGFTGNSGQTSAPSTTTAIDSSGCLYIGGRAPACQVYRIGTPTNAGNFFFPLAQITTGALTVSESQMNWSFLARSIMVPPGAWFSLAASAVLTTAVIQCGIMWEEFQFP